MLNWFLPLACDGFACVSSECAGSFVVVDASGRDEALESGSKIGCVVSRVLFHDQVRALEKSGKW
jgi:hypothetical protein